MSPQQLIPITERAINWLLSVTPNIVAAVALLVVGYILAKLAARWVDRLTDRMPHIDRSLQIIFSRLIKYIFMVLAGVAALGQLGVQTTSLLAALGAVGLGIGLALKDTLSNVASGIMLLWLRPFRIGDGIDVGTSSGTVEEIGLFATKIKTLEGPIDYVPNSQIWSDTITNKTVSGTRMVREVFAVAYGDDLDKGRQILLDLIATDDRFLADPAAKVVVTTLGDNAVSLEARAWTNVADWGATRFDFIESGKAKLEAGGLSIPFPQQDVYVKTLPENKKSEGKKSEGKKQVMN